MCIANTTSCTSFSAFAPSKTWTLTSGDGLKTVTVIVKDSKGNASTFSDTIRLDATVPSGGTLSARPSNQQVALTWTAATDAGSGIASYAIVVAPVTAPTCSAGALVYSGTATNFTHTGLVNGNVYGYHLCPIDGAGNIGAGSTITARPVPEYDPPHGSVIIDGGATLTASTLATLTLTATDASGVASMCISNTGSCSAYIPFAATSTWTLANANGASTVYAWFRDIYGNTNTAPVSATIVVDTKVPALGNFTSTTAAGSGTVQLSWTAASDVSGIASYQLVWQTGTTAPASCTVGNLIFSGNALSFTHSGRANGNYSYRLCAVDRAGNVSSVSRSVTVR
jgi:hypothetical protein